MNKKLKPQQIITIPDVIHNFYRNKEWSVYHGVVYSLISERYVDSSDASGLLTIECNIHGINEQHNEPVGITDTGIRAIQDLYVKIKSSDTTEHGLDDDGDGRIRRAGTQYEVTLHKANSLAEALMYISNKDNNNQIVRLMHKYNEDCKIIKDKNIMYAELILDMVKSKIHNYNLKFLEIDKVAVSKIHPGQYIYTNAGLNMVDNFPNEFIELGNVIMDLHSKKYKDIFTPSHTYYNNDINKDNENPNIAFKLIEHEVNTDDNKVILKVERLDNITNTKAFVMTLSVDKDDYDKHIKPDNIVYQIDVDFNNNQVIIENRIDEIINAKLLHNEVYNGINISNTNTEYKDVKQRH